MSGLIPGEGRPVGMTPWWDGEWAGKDRHRHVIDWAISIRNRQERWRKRDLMHACLYGNMEILGFGPSNFWKFGNDDGRLTVNHIKSKVDTWVSMICRSKPEAMFLPSPSGAEPTERWTLRRLCKQSERFCNGKLKEQKFHEDLAPLAVLDVGIFDYGEVKVSISGVDDAEQDWSRADVCLDRAYPHQQIINDAEAMNGNPRTRAERKPIDRWVLAGKFPDKRAEILSCPKGFQADESGTNEEDSDVICVTEIWHLPSVEGTDDGSDKPWNGSDDGRHCLVIENATLIDEPYECNRFPFARLTQMPVPMGIRGQSICHQLRPLQVSVNALALDFQDTVHTMSRAKWLIPNQSGVDKGHVDDQIASEIWYDAPYKPEAWCPQGIAGDAYTFWKDQQSLMDDIVGISEGRSGGTVPTNLKSGRAIQEANASQDGRFLISSRMFEAFCMDVVALIVDKSRIIGKHRKDYASRFIQTKGGRKKTVVIPWKNAASLKSSQYTLDCYPASAFANDPGARYDQLSEMRDRGDISREVYNQLMDWPDVAGEMRLMNAPLDLADMLIERYLDAQDVDEPALYPMPFVCGV